MQYLFSVSSTPVLLCECLCVSTSVPTVTARSHSAGTRLRQITLQMALCLRILAYGSQVKKKNVLCGMHVNLVYTMLVARREKEKN